MALTNTDTFLINRNSNSYTKTAVDLYDDIQDTDLLLVNRSSKSYQQTGLDFKESIKSNTTFRSAVLTEIKPDGDRFTSEEFVLIADYDPGVPAAQLSLKIVIAAELYDPETDSITSTELFAKLDSDFNIIDLQSSDPGFSEFPGDTRRVSFPRIFPDGQAPDLSLLPGITIKAFVQANNLHFPPTVVESNTLIPNQLAQLSAATPSDVTTYNTISAALQNYELNRDAVRATLKDSMLANNFTEADISSLNL